MGVEVRATHDRGAQAKPLLDKLRRMWEAAEEGGPVSGGFSIEMNGRYFGPKMEEVGLRLWRIVDDVASDVGNMNFAYVTNALRDLLLPSISLYYLSRASQLGARQAVINHFVPYLFITGKVNYMQASRFELHFAYTAPFDILEQLQNPGSSTTNLLGVNPHGNVEDDEAQEMSGVKGAKQAAFSGTAEALRVGVFTSAQLSRGPLRAETEIAPASSAPALVESERRG